MVNIIPSILTNDPDELRQLMARLERVVERASIDIIDGKFVDNKTIDPRVVGEVETDLLLDFQLMVVEPINWVEKCVRAGADRIIGHIEKMSSQAEFVAKVHQGGIDAGLGIDLATPVDQIDESLLAVVDVILVMSVPAGFGGQDFDQQALDKIKKLDEMRDKKGLDFKIHDDGGVTLEWIDDIERVGVDEVSIGRRLFEGDVGENIKKFQEAAYG